MRLYKDSTGLGLVKLIREFMPLLQIVTSGHCFGCQETLRFYEEVAKRFPDLRVELIDLESADQEKPEAVIAVP